MQEILSVKQDAASGSARKRWFRSDTFDIFVWQGEGDHFTSLHLCYGRGEDEHILRWAEGGGFHHESVDADETKPGRAMTAILRANGAFPSDVVLRSFLDVSSLLPANVAAFVEDRIRQCPVLPARV